jgi:hypothetical protein
MSGARIEFEEGEAEGFARFGKGSEGVQQYLLEDFEGAAFDSLHCGLRYGFSQDASRGPGLV